MTPREKIATYVKLLLAEGAEKHPGKNHHSYALGWIQGELEDLYAYARGLCDSLTEDRCVMEVSIHHAAMRVFLDALERRFGELVLKGARRELWPRSESSQPRSSTNGKSTGSSSTESSLKENA